jgi:hypothetical protein
MSVVMAGGWQSSGDGWSVATQDVHDKRMVGCGKVLFNKQL